MINKVILVGNVGSEPESINFDNGGSIVKFTLATTKTYKDKSGITKKDTTWHNIKVTSAGLQSVCLNHIQKGTLLYIEGSIEINETKTGAKFTNIVLGAYDSTLKILKFSEPKNTQQQIPQTQTDAKDVEQAVAGLLDDMPF